MSRRPEFPMIRKHHTDGPRLDVAGLNEITVLIDRSETERSEVAVNTWLPGRASPPHSHQAKEQNFFVLAGRGEVKLGRDKHPAAPGAFFYVPAGLVHQTLSVPDEPLCYFLFNAFLDADKEGHASFASHIEQVKETRRLQALNQRADSGPAHESTRATRPPKFVPPASSADGPAWEMLLSREESQCCEAIRLRAAPGKKLALPADPLKEQTIFVVSGDAMLAFGGESAPITTGYTAFIPRNTSVDLKAGDDGFLFLSFGSLRSPS